MEKHKFTLEYTDDQVRIHHNEPPRFVAAINASSIEIIEWKDKRPVSDYNAYKIASLIIAAEEAYERHEKAIQRDIRHAMDDLNDEPKE